MRLLARIAYAEAVYNPHAVVASRAYHSCTPEQCRKTAPSVSCGVCRTAPIEIDHMIRKPWKTPAVLLPSVEDDYDGGSASDIQLAGDGDPAQSYGFVPAHPPVLFLDYDKAPLPVERAKAEHDVLMFGYGFICDGLHVPVAEVIEYRHDAGANFRIRTKSYFEFRAANYLTQSRASRYAGNAYSFIGFDECTMFYDGALKRNKSRGWRRHERKRKANSKQQ